MQTMVELSIRSGKTVNAELDALLGELSRVDELPISQLYKEQVQRLFSYGMNACGDRELVKDCLLALFALVSNHPKPMRAARSVDSSFLKFFRGILIQQMADRRNSSVVDVLDGFFPAGPVRIRQLTGVQREAMYLRFNSGLRCDEVSIVMGLRIDQVRSQVTQAVEMLAHQPVTERL